MASLACGGGASGRAATAEALAGSIARTATAAAGQGGEDAAVRTAEANANATALSSAATEAARAVEDAAAQSATATAIAPMLADLPRYGLDSSSGQPGWVHPPASLEVEGHRQYQYENEFIATVARDFVVSSDITWNTQYGTSGCGFVLRSDGNQDALNQYLVIATRGAGGHGGFVAMVNGQVDRGSAREVYAEGTDPAFSPQNDATNRLTVVGQGPTLTVYTNGTRVGQFTNDRFDRGFIALVALSESGRTVCQFNNTWLWLLNQ